MKLTDGEETEWPPTVVSLGTAQTLCRSFPRVKESTLRTRVVRGDTTGSFNYFAISENFENKSGLSIASFGWEQRYKRCRLISRSSVQLFFLDVDIDIILELLISNYWHRQPQKGCPPIILCSNHYLFLCWSMNFWLLLLVRIWLGIRCLIVRSQPQTVSFFWIAFIYLMEIQYIKYINIAPSEGTPIQAVAQRDRALEN